MKIEEILEMEDVKKMISILCSEQVGAVTRAKEKWEKEYTGEHEILNRQNKDVGAAPEKDEEGNLTKDTRKTVITAKIPIPVQKNIVRSAVTFSVGGGTELKLNNIDDEGIQKAFELIKQTLKNVKIDSFNMKLAKRLTVESDVAELWYVKTTKTNKGVEKKIKVTLLCNENGDEIYPHYDEYGDMDAFTRKFWIKDEKNRPILNITIYTAEKILSISKSLSGYSYVPNIIDNPFGKIPIIYYDQKEPEWKDVQVMIDRLEMITSKLADMNDYFASPSVKIKGKISAPPNKDEIGKIFQIEGEQGMDGRTVYGDIEYLVWRNSPVTVKFEVELLLKFINSLTSTPDISFDNIKNITGNISGVALKLLFLDSILKGKEKQLFVLGEGFNRRINLLKEILSVTDASQKENIMKTDITVLYKSILPEDIIELINALSTSRPGSNLISQETATGMHPFVEDTKIESEKLEKEEENKGGSFEF